MADHKNGDTASWDKEQVRRAQPPQKRPRRKRRHRFAFALLKLVLHIVFVLLASALLAEIGWLLFSDFCSLNNGGQKATENISVQITADDTVSSIAEKLGEAGLVDYPWFFRLYAQFSHAEEKIGIGTYNLNNDMDYHALIAGMHSSSGSMNEDTVRVTIPEGYTVAQTISLLAKNGVNTETALLEAAKTANFNYDLIDTDSEEISRLEGYLFPDTYDFYKGEDLEDVIGKFLWNFHQKLSGRLQEKVDASGMTLDQVVTLASIIQAEAAGTTDMFNVSAVLHNRLNFGGDYGIYNLECDSTSFYPYKNQQEMDQMGGTLSHGAYDTYQVSGLPAGAICNPGLDALNAALKPNDSGDAARYLYFCHSAEGEAFYATNADDHEYNKQLAGLE